MHELKHEYSSSRSGSSIPNQLSIVKTNGFSQLKQDSMQPWLWILRYSGQRIVCFFIQHRLATSNLLSCNSWGRSWNYNFDFISFDIYWNDWFRKVIKKGLRWEKLIWKIKSYFSDVFLMNLHRKQLHVPLISSLRININWYMSYWLNIQDSYQQMYF